MAARTSELLRIFDDVYKTKVSYCMLCLRTEKERRLVRPHYISMFLQTLNVSCGLLDASKRVCYICEKQAASALRVRRTVSFAMSIESLFRNMTNRRKYEEDVRNHLTGRRTSKNKYIDQKAAEWERQLTQIRIQTQLLQTEVLVVDSAGVQMTVAQPEKEDIYVVPDAVSHEETCKAIENILSEPEIDVDSVIILDEEEDPIDIKPKVTPEPILTIDGTTMPKLVPIEKLLESPHATNNIAIMPDEMQLMIRQPNEPQNFILHSIVAGPDGDLSVPSLSAKIINGHLVFPNPASNPKLLENTVFPMQNLPQPQMVIQNKRNLENINTINNLNQVDSILESILKEKADALQKKRTPETDVKNNKKVKQSDETEKESARPPVMRSDRIDWEDKIPMDVISFMDATDPNAVMLAPEAAANVGFISDIRSLQPRASSPDTGCAVIDLC